jgi:hypothetical protein
MVYLLEPFIRWEILFMVHPLEPFIRWQILFKERYTR